MRILGIDPGFSGGLSLFEDGKCLEAFKMPIKENGKRKNINALVIAKYIKANKIDKAVIELVHSMPRQGIASAFYFGRGVGTLVGTCEACEIPVIEYSPQNWKKNVLADLYDHETKDGTIKYCQEHFSHINLLATSRSKVPHDGIADAICIGYNYFININKDTQKE